MYEVTVVYGAGKGEVMWPGPEIIVMIGLGGKKSMQHVLLEAQEAAEQCVVIVVEVVIVWSMREITRSVKVALKVLLQSFLSTSIYRTGLQKLSI